MTPSSAPAVLKVTILLFAQYAEAVGRSRVDISLPAGGTVADLLAELRRQIPEAGALPARLMCAVNLSHVLPSHQLRDGDEVAVLPPLAGG